MSESNSFPKVVLKRKNIQTVVDFCLDESIEFTVRQQDFPDTDWEVELKIEDIHKALMAGMFIRENRLEVEGIDSSKFKKNNKKQSSNKSTKSNSGSSNQSNESATETETSTETETENEANEASTEINAFQSEDTSNSEENKTDEKPSPTLEF